MFKDLREFIAALEAADLLEHVKAPVDPEWEINGITNKMMRDFGPALMFDNIFGSEPVATMTFLPVNS